MNNTRLFTSEQVSDGHPDKICDQISDSILDECLKQDPMSRVAIEVAVKCDLVYVFGELSTHAEVDIDHTVRKVLTRIGYDYPKWGLEPWKVKIFKNITEQSPEIGNGVTKKNAKIGAGDQGIMFGYAVKETPEMMPLPLQLCNMLMKEHKRIRTSQNSVLDNGSDIGPDAKCQVTVEYDRGTDEPSHINTVVLSTLHQEMNKRQYALLLDWLENTIRDNFINYNHLITNDTRILINPAGPWTVGGPQADAGLTGRKIIADTYGGAARHGGGAFSGKDATKVDRSAAYAARHLAKWVCNLHGRYRTEVQLSYAIGVEEPVSVHIYGMSQDEVQNVLKHYPYKLDPASIIENFELRKPIFLETATYGHFGREEFPWEKL